MPRSEDLSKPIVSSRHSLTLLPIQVLYQARIHPEQYCNTFDDKQTKELHDALVYVCTTAVETLADSKQFPDDWIMKYRWDKGKKASNVLPNGEKIVHLTVGGRTSAVVPSRQKKTAAVAGDVKAEDLEDGDEAAKPAKSAKGRKRKAKDEDEDEAKQEEVPEAKRSVRGGKKVQYVEEEEERDEAQVDGGAEQPKKTPSKSKKSKKAASKKAEKPVTPGERQSTRNKAK